MELGILKQFGTTWQVFNFFSSLKNNSNLLLSIVPGIHAVWVQKGVYIVAVFSFVHYIKCMIFGHFAVMVKFINYCRIVLICSNEYLLGDLCLALHCKAFTLDQCSESHLMIWPNPDPDSLLIQILLNY